MIGTVVLLVIAMSAVLVYLDASAHKIGDISRYRRNFNRSAMYWAIATLFVWPYALPYYLRIRGKLIEAAVAHPIRENWRLVKASGVTVIAASFVLGSMAFPGLQTKVDHAFCSGSETRASILTTQSVNSVVSTIKSGNVKNSAMVQTVQNDDLTGKNCHGFSNAYEAASSAQ